MVLDLGELDEMYETDVCRWYDNPSIESSDSDNARHCENEISDGYLRASFLRHPKRKVSCPPPQSRGFLLHYTSDPSY